MKRYFAPVLALSLLAGACPVFAQEDATAGEETPDDEEGSDEEAPGDEAPADEGPAPARTLVLANGETLHGQLVQVQGGKVKFKSDNMGDVEFGLDQIETLDVAEAHTVIMPGGGKVEAKVRIEGGQITVTPIDGSEPTTFAADAQLVVNPDPEKTELDYWNFTGTLGASATYGNTRIRTFFALATLTREDDNTKLRLAYTGVYGVDAKRGGAGENAKAHRGDFQFDYKVTERFYVTPVVGHLLYDKFANIERRGSIGSGVGYKILIQDDLKWGAELGFAYTEIRTWREPLNAVGVEIPPFNETKYQTSARLASVFYWKLSEKLTFDAFWESYIGTKRIKDTFHRATFNVGYQLSGMFSLGLGGIYDRIENPERAGSGSTPRRDDLKLTLTLTVSF